MISGVPPASPAPSVAVLAPIYPPALDRLERTYLVQRAFESDDALAALRACPPGTRALVTTGLVGFRSEHLDALPDLGLVAVFGVGHGTLDLDAAHARRIVVTNTPDSTHATVADLAIGLILAVTRRIVEADAFVRAGRWPDGPFSLGRGLAGRRCGLVGYGRIGRHIADRLQPFGVELAYYARHFQADDRVRYEPSLAALAAWADLLVVACPLNESTRGMVDAGILRALGPEGALVNVARGPIVDRQALLAAVEAGTIAGVGLDVYWNEPDVPAELVASPRVVLLPHIGTSTREIREERTAGLLANLAAFFSGRAVPSPVSA